MKQAGLEIVGNFGGGAAGAGFGEDAFLGAVFDPLAADQRDAHGQNTKQNHPQAVALPANGGEFGLLHLPVASQDVDLMLAALGIVTGLEGVEPLARALADGRIGRGGQLALEIQGGPEIAPGLMIEGESAVDPREDGLALEFLGVLQRRVQVGRNFVEPAEEPEGRGV